MRLPTMTLCGVMLLAPGSLAAQPVGGSVELGGFGHFTNFDAGAGCPCEWPRDAFGLGGRAGVFLSPRWGVELDASTANAARVIGAGNIRYTSLAARLGVNVFPAAADGVVSFLAALGPSVLRYGDGEARWGASGLAGARWHPAGPIALRVAGVADYAPGDDNLNLSARAGVSLLLRTATRPRAALAPPAPPPTPAPPPEPPPAMPPEVAGPAGPDATELDILLEPVFFDFDRAEIRPDARAVLDRKAAILRRFDHLRLMLEGNADERGSTGYNFELGLRRANAVSSYLAASGIAAHRLEVVSHGETRPTCAESPADEACHQLNRRVDFRVLPMIRDTDD